MSTELKAHQGELFQAKATFFRVLHALIDSGEWGKMSAPASKIYITAKSFLNWKTGAAFPSLDTLEKSSRLSRPTIIKALKELEQLGYLHANKTSGKKTVYTMSEKVPVTDEEGQEVAVFRFPSVGPIFQPALEEIKTMVTKGILADGKHVTLNLTVNIAGRDNVVTQNYDMSPHYLKALIKRLAAGGNMEGLEDEVLASVRQLPGAAGPRERNTQSDDQGPGPDEEG